MIARWFGMTMRRWWQDRQRWFTGRAEDARDRAEWWRAWVARL